MNKEEKVCQIKAKLNNYKEFWLKELNKQIRLTKE